ncbi:hypothetical protein Fcan01_11554 [Folsomia candida]|uniref:Uncharacterized protein n=1 Tax=Folsomia candida TaxID=158441 RepID=A0A226EC58_FOLCA|nr:hypothetical protein Fcan01_11554 [Folsomia candida]
MNCGSCNSIIAVRQQCLQCLQFHHRICLPTVSNHEWPTIKNGIWYCTLFQTGDNNNINISIDQKTTNSNLFEVLPLHHFQDITTQDFPHEQSSALPPPPHDSSIVHDLYNRFKTSKGLKICDQNINSIRSKFDDVLSLICNQNINIDLISFIESKLDPDRDKDSILYTHPATPKAKLVDFSRELNTYLISFDAEYYILGDFNLDLLKRDADSYSIFNAGKEFRLWQHMVGPTYKDYHY